MKQLRKVSMSRTRDIVEVDESYFVLNPAALIYYTKQRIVTLCCWLNESFRFY